ncbi:jg9685 [Pararge aegeria aegeria]|uniref:Tafazzin family protein n=1 Tax=Pararge aegeria aegeria TaxID=348720 RepID=A0A8S4RTE2_9NEOP|nr:jg9685 [Pararge aegeria aegeria]
MAYDIGWIIPRLRNPGRLWTCASSITVAVVGLFSKLIVDFLNKTTVYNREALQRAVRRPRGVPLLTVSNHHSCFDDPGLWGNYPPPRSRRLAERDRGVQPHSSTVTSAIIGRVNMIVGVAIQETPVPTGLVQTVINAGSGPCAGVRTRCKCGVARRLKSANASEEETRRAITERIQDELLKLRDHTHARMAPPAANGARRHKDA